MADVKDVLEVRRESVLKMAAENNTAADHRRIYRNWEVICETKKSPKQQPRPLGTGGHPVLHVGVGRGEFLCFVFWRETGSGCPPSGVGSCFTS